MRAAVLPLATRFGWTVDEVDIDADAVLERRWSDSVPVLLAGEKELCHYWIDEAAVTAFLSAASDAKSR
jgi:thioredoxin reductase (NADPH)